MAAYLARVHLVYGDWLRREQQRVELREHLRAAHDIRPACAAAFAERGPPEAPSDRRDGAQAHRRHARGLTVPEVQAARQAAEGHAKPEIGALMFISPGPRSATCTRCFQGGVSAPAGSSGTA